MADEIDPKLKKILEHYTPDQLNAPDQRYGTVEERLKAVYKEAPKKAEEEFNQEVEKQLKEVNAQAAKPRTGIAR
jgi:hypothetical protein